MIQEGGKRKLLSEKNTKMELKKRNTKRKQGGKDGKENEEMFKSSQKRGKIVAMESEEITMLKVVEPNLNVAPKSL